MIKTRVLFVCTGNICRSPSAEGAFRHYVAQKDLDKGFMVDSAGTHGYHVGEPPDPRAIAAARARGIKMDDLRARQVASKDFETFDFILAMDGGHYDVLQNMLPSGSKSHLALFMDYSPVSKGMDVPDPYYGSIEDFEYALDLIEEGAKGLLEHLKTKVG